MRGGLDLIDWGGPNPRRPAPLPGPSAWQDPEDIGLLVASHTFQRAALDLGWGLRLPFECEAHVLIGFWQAVE